MPQTGAQIEEVHFKKPMHFKYNLDSVNTYNSSTIDLHERLQDWLFRWKNAMFDSVVHETCL